jgi:hypothetical protein
VKLQTRPALLNRIKFSKALLRKHNYDKARAVLAESCSLKQSVRYWLQTSQYPLQHSLNVLQRRGQTCLNGLIKIKNLFLLLAVHFHAYVQFLLQMRVSNIHSVYTTYILNNNVISTYFYYYLELFLNIKLHPSICLREVYVTLVFSSNLCCGTLGTAATTGLLYQPRMIGDGDYGEIGGIKIGRGNQSNLRKPGPARLCPPQIPHD